MKTKYYNIISIPIKLGFLQDNYDYIAYGDVVIKNTFEVIGHENIDVNCYNEDGEEIQPLIDINIVKQKLSQKALEELTRADFEIDQEEC